jgi:hypothetical protein
VRQGDVEVEDSGRRAVRGTVFIAEVIRASPANALGRATASFYVLTGQFCVTNRSLRSAVLRDRDQRHRCTGAEPGDASARVASWAACRVGNAGRRSEP